MIKELEEIIKSKGFSSYKWINPGNIIVAQWVRVKCMFGCADYGLGACPPNTPSVDECRRFFDEYKYAVIFTLKKFADKNQYPSQWSREMTDKLLETEKQIFLSGYQKAFLLNQTCCCLCKDCPGNRYDCIDKTNSRPSPEGFAVDVYQTLRNNGFEINVVKNNPNDMIRVAILMIE